MISPTLLPRQLSLGTFGIKTGLNMECMAAISLIGLMGIKSSLNT